MDKQALINRITNIRDMANNGLTCIKINGRVVKSKELGNLTHEDELKEIVEAADELLLELELEE